MPIGKIDPFVFKLIEVLADPYAIFGADGKIIRQNDAFSRWVWPLRAQPESNGSFYDLFSPSKKNTLEAAIGTIIRFGSPGVPAFFSSLSRGYRYRYRHLRRRIG